ncbi:MAG: chemotaxis-specific protein-glutamate methyltransferase CheB [Solirubrobacterales bacterium]
MTLVPMQPPTSSQSAPQPVSTVAPIRLLIVDDSGFMRTAIRKMVERDGRVQVVGEARNGLIGVEMARSLRPDVITMDIEMPELNGLDATRLIMREIPTPIIMVSSLTQASADVTVRALREGAVDYISKSSSFVALDIIQIEQELKEKISYWARRRGFSPPSAAASPQRSAAPPAADRLRGPVEIVVIGVSTGGPKTVPELLAQTGRLNCPVVVAQHMPEIFTASFAQQLARDTGLSVMEGTDGQDLAPGTVTILKGGTDTEIVRRANGHLGLWVRLHADAPIHPSVDVLFASVAKASVQPVGVILTGMGDDGTRGGLDLVRRGFPVLAQEPDTCIVGGMPGAALGAGAATQSLAIPALAAKLRAWAGAR